MLRNTLFIAGCIDKHLENKYIQRYIYNQPSASTFSELSEFKEQLKTAVIQQTASYEAFEQLVGLEAGAWMNRSGDIIDSLIIRNDEALNNGDALQNWLDILVKRDFLSQYGWRKYHPRKSQYQTFV